jgi:hypothetical protein
MDDELAIVVDAQIAVQVEVDHDHGAERLVPMIEQIDRADLAFDGPSVRVFYRCPECGQSVSVRTVADAAAGPRVGFGG